MLYYMTRIFQEGDDIKEEIISIERIVRVRIIADSRRDKYFRQKTRQTNNS